MKKIYFIAIAMVLALSVSAQNVIETKSYSAVPVEEASFSMFYQKVNMDTLGLDEFFTYTVDAWTLGYLGGGYVFGNNVEENCQFGQGYFDLVGGNVGLVGAFMWISNIYINSASPHSDITVTANLIDAQSTYGTTPPNYDDYTIDCPGTVLGTTTFNISAVDTTFAGAYGFHSADFPTIISIANGTDFALVVNSCAALTAGDTIGFIASDEGVVSSIYTEEYGWWMYPAGTNSFWTQTSHVFTGAGTRMPAIFAVIDRDFVNVDEHAYFQNMQLTLSPNPTADILTVAYAINMDMNTRIEVIDMNGRIIHSSATEFHSTGAYSITIDVSSYAAGQYLVSVVSEAGRLTKKLIVQ